MCAAQCGSMEAKALSFVLRAAGSEHHMSSTRRMFTYVVGGRVGMNDACYFTLDMKKLDPTPPHPTPPPHPTCCVAVHSVALRTGEEKNDKTLPRFSGRRQKLDIDCKHGMGAVKLRPSWRNFSPQKNGWCKLFFSPTKILNLRPSWRNSCPCKHGHPSWRWNGALSVFWWWLGYRHQRC